MLLLEKQILRCYSSFSRSASQAPISRRRRGRRLRPHARRRRHQLPEVPPGRPRPARTRATCAASSASACGPKTTPSTSPSRSPASPHEAEPPGAPGQRVDQECLGDRPSHLPIVARRVRDRRFGEPHTQAVQFDASRNAMNRIEVHHGGRPRRDVRRRPAGFLPLRETRGLFESLGWSASVRSRIVSACVTRNSRSLSRPARRFDSMM